MYDKVNWPQRSDPKASALYALNEIVGWLFFTDSR